MLKRKTILVSIYYSGEEPKIDREDYTANDSLFLNDAIKDVMTNYNPKSEIFDVCIDETKDRLFANHAWWVRYLFRLLRK
jgi:hypothetical protein